jgi:hypothetical protein
VTRGTKLRQTRRGPHRAAADTTARRGLHPTGQEVGDAGGVEAAAEGVAVPSAEGAAGAVDVVGAVGAVDVVGAVGAVDVVAADGASAVAPAWPEPLADPPLSGAGPGWGLVAGTACGGDVVSEAPTVAVVVALDAAGAVL